MSIESDEDDIYNAQFAPEDDFDRDDSADGDSAVSDIERDDSENSDTPGYEDYTLDNMPINNVAEKLPTNFKPGNLLKYYNAV